MKNINALFSKSLLCLTLAGAGTAFANDCPEVPQAPELVDGATSSMEALVENSESVKAFIAEADANLDCREKFAQSDSFGELPKAEQKAYREQIAQLLAERNAIGENFNAEVAAYKEANPQ